MIAPFFGFSKTIYQTTSPTSGEIKVVQKGRERKLLVNGVCQSINFDAPGIENRVWGKISEAVRQLNSLAVGKLSDLNYFTNNGNYARNQQNIVTAPLGKVLTKGGASHFAKATRGRCIAATEGSAATCVNLSCLILGFGAGTVAHLLTRRLPGMGIDGVELDPVIVEVGEKFLDLGRVSDFNIICADAARVVASPADYELRFTNYDVIVVDLYCGGRFPEQFESPEFLLGVNNFLAPGGVAVFNRVFRRGRKDALDRFIEKVERIFGKVELTEVTGPYGFSNLLVIAGWIRK